MTGPPPTGSVIVGVSGTVDDAPVVTWAIDEARRRGVRLVIAHACSWWDDRDAADQPPRHPGLVDAIARARGELGDDRVTITRRRPPAGAMLVSLADPDDLLVVGPPRQSGSAFWSSSTDFVARHALCPVIIVRPGSQTHLAGPVVVGVDGSASARLALGFGFGMASRYGNRLVALHIAARESRGVEQPLALLARETLPWERAYPELRPERVIGHGEPWPGLLRAADGAALLVLGSSGAHRRRSLGSTSLAAISGATTSVAILPAPAA